MPTLANIARRLNLMAGVSESLPPLILVTDEKRLADPIPAARRLPPGSGVLLRHYEDPRRRELAIALSEFCRDRRLSLLIAGDFQLAADVGADGLHLPAWMVGRYGRAMASACRTSGFVVTAAAHDPVELRRADDAGVDAVLLSPVFATASHPDVRPIGPQRFAAWIRGLRVPVYAMGGINARNGRRLALTGAAGIAGIGGFN